MRVGGVGGEWDVGWVLKMIGGVGSVLLSLNGGRGFV